MNVCIIWSDIHYLRRRGWTKAKVHMSLETWRDFDRMLIHSMQIAYLAGFEPVTICFQHRFKMPREFGGFELSLSMFAGETPSLMLRSTSNSQGWSIKNIKGACWKQPNKKWWLIARAFHHCKQSYDMVRVRVVMICVWRLFNCSSFRNFFHSSG